MHIDILTTALSAWGSSITAFEGKAKQLLTLTRNDAERAVDDNLTSSVNK